MLMINFDRKLEEDMINTDETSFQHNALGHIHSEISEWPFFAFTDEQKPRKKWTLRCIFGLLIFGIFDGNGKKRRQRKFGRRNAINIRYQNFRSAWKPALEIGQFVPKLNQHNNFEMKWRVIVLTFCINFPPRHLVSTSLDARYLKPTAVVETTGCLKNSLIFSKCRRTPNRFFVSSILSKKSAPRNLVLLPFVDLAFFDPQHKIILQERLFSDLRLKIFVQDHLYPDVWKIFNIWLEVQELIASSVWKILIPSPWPGAKKISPGISWGPLSRMPSSVCTSICYKFLCYFT